MTLNPVSIKCGEHHSTIRLFRQPLAPSRFASPRLCVSFLKPQASGPSPQTSARPNQHRPGDQEREDR